MINYTNLQNIFNKQIDFLLSNLGTATPIEFNFGVTNLNICPNCIYDPNLKKSSGKYKPNGPKPFPLGRLCPYCNGTGYEGIVKTKPGHLTVLWDYKEWINPPPQLDNPLGYIQTICHKNYLSDIRKCKDIRVIVNNNLDNPVFQLYGEPNYAGLGDNNYLLSIWKKIGTSSHQINNIPIEVPSTPTSTPNKTQTPTPTTSRTPAISPTRTPTITPTRTPVQPAQNGTLTPTPTLTITATPTISASITATPTQIPTSTPTNTQTPTVTPTIASISFLASGTKLPVLGALPESPYPSSQEWSYLLNSNVDDWFYMLDLPFNWKINGINYNKIFLSSNTYITFATGSVSYLGLSESNPPFNKIFLGANDNSIQRISTFTFNNEYMKIRYEGTASPTGIPGLSDIIMEITFYNPAYKQNYNVVELLVGEHASSFGLFGVASNSSWYSQSNLSPYQSYVMIGNSSGNNFTIYSNYYIA